MKPSHKIKLIRQNPFFTNKTQLDIKHVDILTGENLSFIGQFIHQIEREGICKGGGLGVSLFSQLKVSLY